MITPEERKEQFRQYIQDLCKKEVDDEYFVIDGWKLEKAFERIFDEEDKNHDRSEL